MGECFPKLTLFLFPPKIVLFHTQTHCLQEGLLATLTHPVPPTKTWQKGLTYRIIYTLEDLKALYILQEQYIWYLAHIQQWYANISGVEHSYLRVSGILQKD